MARDGAQGHRARLRQRFLEAGPQGVADHEMLELVLFRAIPQRDVKPLAKRLIATFGDFNGALSAPPARLAEVQGVGPAVICELKIVEAAAHRLARARVMNRPALSSWAALMDYCKTVMAHEHNERFRILFLDRKNVLIADEEQARGTVDHVPVYPREVVKRALELNASAIILVHNHPSGDPTPVPGRHRHDTGDRPGAEIGRHRAARPRCRRACERYELPQPRAALTRRCAQGAGRLTRILSDRVSREQIGRLSRLDGQTNPRNADALSRTLVLSSCSRSCASCLGCCYCSMAR